jgi:carbamoyltransferase
MSTILGIGGFSHDSAAALVVDGKLVAAVQEERLTRVKHVGGIPTNAISYCLETSGLTLADLDAITFYTSRKHWTKLCRSYLRSSASHPVDSLMHPGRFLRRLSWHGYRIISFEAELRRYLVASAIPYGKFFDYDHHLCHAASTFYSSPYDEMSVLCVDAVGDGKTTSFWHADENGLREVSPAVPHPHAIASLYSQITRYLGFHSLGDQYKVMGLASYGTPQYLSEMSKLVERRHGGYRLNSDYFDWREDYRLSPKFSEVFGSARLPDEPIEKRHRDIAASLQSFFEGIVLELATFLKEKTGCETLGLAGGSALNCAANGKILRSGLFKNVFVLPCASDLGTCLGAAQYHAHTKLGEPRNFNLTTDAWGPSFDDAEIEAILRRSGVSFTRSHQIETDTARLIANGDIVGWFQGRMEFGPRALGQRSILADPRAPEVKDRVNMTIKFREEFRPFAPMILRENVEEYFGIDCAMPFMTFAVNAEKEYIDKIPSVVHVDGTSRVQTIDKGASPQLHNLISEFKKLTGVPVLLNTSFNLAGEPIVCSPEDALRTFFTCGMDVLAIGSFLVTKSARAQANR